MKNAYGIITFLTYNINIKQSFLKISYIYFLWMLPFWEIKKTEHMSRCYAWHT